MSIVNHKHKHIFIHIPKTAGTSMQRNPWVGNKCHTSVKYYISNNEWRDNYFSWTFVRNPYDRFLSAYKWACFRWNPSDLNEFNVTKNNLSSFDEYFKWVIKTGGHVHDNCSQVAFLKDQSGSINKIDFIGRFENLLVDWNKVCKRIIGVESNLMITNKTDHKHWLLYYDDEKREIIYNMYKEDFDILGYEK